MTNPPVERTPDEQKLHDEQVVEMKRLGIYEEPEAPATDPVPAAPAALPDAAAPSTTPSSEAPTVAPTAKDEPASPAPAQAEPDKPAAPAKPDEPQQPEKKNEGEAAKAPIERPERPHKYIPIPKYQEEKGKWDEERTKLNGEIARLTTLATGAASEKAEVRIGEIANRLGIDKEDVKGIIELARGGQATSVEADPSAAAPTEPAAPAAPTPEAPSAPAPAPEAPPAPSEADVFKKEWTEEALPAFKKDHPDATTEQIEDVRTKLEELAFTPEYARYPLDAIVLKEAKLFEDILALPRKATAESGRPGHGGAPTGEPVKHDLSTPEGVKAREAELNAAAAAEEEDRGTRVMRGGKEIKV